MGTYTIFAVFSTDFSISISLVFINIKIDVFSKLFNIIFYEGGGGGGGTPIFIAILMILYSIIYSYIMEDVIRSRQSMMN